MQTIIKKNKIPYVDFGGRGPLLHFAHANGYPPEVYQKFLKPLLPHFRIIAMHKRPLWPGTQPEKTRKWKELASDMIQFFEEQNAEEVIALGHSLGGAVSLFAADKRPDLFKNLVFIDPVFLPMKIIAWQYFFPNTIMKKIVPPAKVAMRRRDRWDSPQVMFDSFRKKKVFRHIADKVLWDMVNYGTKPGRNGEITLRFPKAWEAQIYSMPPMIWPVLKRLQLPSLGIRAEFTDVITQASWKKWQRYQPGAEYLEFKEAGHLLPFEKPEALAKAILNYLT